MMDAQIRTSLDVVSIRDGLIKVLIVPRIYVEYLSPTRLGNFIRQGVIR